MFSTDEGLTITVTHGVGTGSTDLSAFDAALVAAGAANFNLVRLSSVIPAAARIVVDPAGHRPPGAWGDRLYCVYAERTALVPGEQAWAGIGWVISLDGSGRGLFVEHDAASEAELRSLIDSSLADLVASRGGGFGRPSMRVVGATCHEHPATAVVMASYQTSGWSRGSEGEPRCA